MKLLFKLNRATFGALVVLCALDATAAEVTVTAEFTRFTMGKFTFNSVQDELNGQPFDPDLAGRRGLSINGASINLCDGDPNCALAYQQPELISRPLVGSSVLFGYDYSLPYWLGETPNMNEVKFIGNSTEVSGTGAANSFKLGTLEFTNGGFFPAAYVDMTLTTHSLDSRLDGKTINARILVQTNVYTSFENYNQDVFARLNADMIVVQDATGVAIPSLGSLRVFDLDSCPPAPQACANTGSASLNGYIASLHLASLSNPSGASFLDASTSAMLSAVPEVPSSILVTFGMGVIGAFVRRDGIRILRSKA